MRGRHRQQATAFAPPGTSRAAAAAAGVRREILLHYLLSKVS